MAKTVASGSPSFRFADLRTSIQFERFTISTSSTTSASRGRKQQWRSCRAFSATRELYQTLGLSPGASEHDIKRAYRRLALQYHPDVCQGKVCETKFMQIKDAYQALMDQGASHSYCPESFMGVNDDSWEDWEEWMGWEGAGIRDYSSHINYAL